MGVFRQEKWRKTRSGIRKFAFEGLVSRFWNAEWRKIATFAFREFRVMIDLTTHYVLSITSSTIIGTAAVFLALTRIPHGGKWAAVSRARWILFATFAILALSGYFKVSDENPTLLSLTTLCVGSYQALLFTYTASVLASPGGVSRRKFTTVLAAVTAAVAALAATLVWFPHEFHIAWPAAVAAYCVQLCIHTVSFRDLSRTAQEQLESFYDENVDHYLRPVKALFYSALGVGVFALVFAIVPLRNLGYNVFVAFYTVYYIWVASTVINYSVTGDFFIRAEAQPNDGKQDKLIDVSPEGYMPQLKIELNNWVRRRGYLRIETSTDKIAEELGVTRLQLSAYFKYVHHTSFRSWRMALRLQYAQELIRNDKNLKISHLYGMVGFNDRSNFHNEFRKYTGLSPQTYRDKYGPKK